MYIQSVFGCLFGVFAVIWAELPDDYYQDLESDRSGPIAEVWNPSDLELGQVSGIGVDSEGNVHVFHRGSRVWDMDSFDSNNRFSKEQGPIKEATHLKINRETREVMERMGADQFYMPHGLSIDDKDNVWLTDVAMHQVFKLPAGEDTPSLVLGKEFEPGSDEKHFCKPTDVAVATTGEFFVADGYCNGRIMKFAEDGTFLNSFGKIDDGLVYPPPPMTFSVPHSLALVESWNMLCVADREHKRIQCFTAGLKPEAKRSLPTGMFIKEADNIGRVFAIRQKDHFLFGVTNMGLEGGPNHLFVVDLENGEARTFSPGLENPHDLAIGQDDALYVGEIGPNRIVKISL